MKLAVPKGWVLNNLRIPFGYIAYSTKFWQEKNLVNLPNRMAFANILPSKIHLYIFEMFVCEYQEKLNVLTLGPQYPLSRLS